MAACLDDIRDMDIKGAVENVMNSRMKDLESGTLTKKEVRRQVEENLGLAKKSLDGKKKFITRCIEDFIASQSQEEEEEEEDESSEPPRKRQKRETKKKTKAKSKTKKTKKATKKKAAKKADPEEPKVQKCKLTIAGGKIQPKKGIKDAQRNIMSAENFKLNATKFEIDVFGNKLESFPRTFSSGNKGWWGGGKVWIPIGDQKLWATLNLNLTVIGSKEWHETEEDFLASKKEEEDEEEEEEDEESDEAED